MKARRQLLDFATVVAMLAVVALAYRPASNATLLWDDLYLTSPAATFRKQPLRALLVNGFWPGSALADAQPPYYRPVTLLTLRLDAALGDTARDYHATNVLLHLFAAVFLVTAAARLGASWRAAAIGASIWALSPRLTESVVWISGRSDVLAAVFGFAALTVVPDIAPGGRQPRARAALRTVAAATCLFLALCSKEVALAFAAAIVAGAVRSAVWRRPGALLRITMSVVPPVVACAVLRQMALAGRVSPARELGTARRAATVLETLWRYVEMTADATHPRTSIGMLGEVDPTRATLGGCLAVLVLLAALRWRKAPAPAFIAGTLGIVSVGLVLHIVPLSLAGAVAADRLLYVPLGALLIGISVGMTRSRAIVRWSAALGAMVVAVLFFRATRARAAEYSSDLAFWVIAAEHAHPHNTTPRNVLAGLVGAAGDAALSCRLYERSAEVLASNAAATVTAQRRTRENLVRCWAKTGRYDAALQLAEELAREDPASGRIQMGLGFARLHVRDFRGAAAALTTAVSLDPRLEPVVRPVLSAIPQTRAASLALAAPGAGSTAEARLAWAKHLAALGRAPEADAAHLALVVDPSVPLPMRADAATFLAVDGSTASAEAAFAELRPALGTGVLARVMENQLSPRRARLKDLEALRARVEALTR